jgi:O-antigen chain-terminating methyltransferase
MEEKIENKIEINDNEINTEDIMRQIRENIKMRKGAKDIESISEPMKKAYKNIPDDLRHNIDYINSNWEIGTEYRISSHQPIIGRLLIWGRKLVHNEVRRYVDIMIGKQSEFNAHIVHILNGNTKDIDTKINDAIVAANKDIDTKINDAIGKETNSSRYDILNYFLFEEKFRGNTEEIKSRQSMFLEYFKNSNNVLDIGCGRGEFLSLLKENGIGAKGIDINEDMVLYCKKNNLDVEKVDVLSYLKLLKDKSLDGVFSGQVVEHLKPKQLTYIIKLCHDKMKYGTYFVAETVNPQCLYVFANSFYMDLSHIKPIHPETIKFILESVGFRDIQFKFFSPCPETVRLSKFETNENTNSDEKANIEIMNKNVEKINLLLYGYQDYAVIAKK